MWNVPRVKICCISSPEEAETAIRCGASALGLVSHMPVGPGVISEEKIFEIARQVPPPISTFLLTSRRDAGEIIDQVRRCRTQVVQLCDRLAPASRREIREALPGVRVVQVVHVVDEASVAEATEAAVHADAVLLDSGRLPSSPMGRMDEAAVPELGGTGRTHDWRVSRKIRDTVPVPVFLAGGLNATNVARAVRQVEPFAVDLCSSVRTDDRLDEAKLAIFFEAIRNSCVAASGSHPAVDAHGLAGDGTRGCQE